MKTYFPLYARALSCHAVSTRPLYVGLLLLIAATSTAQVPSITTASKLRFTEGNTIFDRTVGDIFSTIDVDLTTGVTGILPVANGGTGVNTITANRIPYGNGTGALQTSANLTFSGTNLALGGVTAVSMIEGPSSNTNSTLKIGKAELQSFTGTDANIILTSNAYYNAAWKYRADGYASVFQMYNGDFEFYTSTSSGTAGGSFTATRLLTGSPTGYVNVGNIAAGTITSKLGVRGSGATSSTSSLHVQNSSSNTLLYARDDVRVGIGTTSPLSGLHYETSENAYGAGVTIRNNNSGANAQSRIHLFGTSGTSYTANGAALYFWVPNNTLGFWLYEDGPIRLGTNNTERFAILGSGETGVGLATPTARFHTRGAGATSGTNTAVFENSAGTAALTIRDDLMSAFGTTPGSTTKLIVRGATADTTANALDAQRSSGTAVLKARNDGKVTVNNAFAFDALNVNGWTRTDGLVLSNQTGSQVSSGKVQYNNGTSGTYSGYLTLGDGTRQLAIMPTMIERHVLDWAVNWTTGRKGAFWTVPARFDGWKIAKVYIEVTAIGAGAGDDELSIEVSGVVEGTQIITAGTHTLVMDEVVNTDDIVTFNITEISATPAQGLHVSLELSKN